MADKIKIKEIKILWAEGKDYGYPKTFKTWYDVNQDLRKVHRDFVKSGGQGYNKTKFNATWKDGETYEGRLDISDREDNPSITDNVVGEHIKEFLEFSLKPTLTNSKGKVDPNPYYSDEQAKEVRLWLNKYDLGLKEGKVIKLIPKSTPGSKTKTSTPGSKKFIPGKTYIMSWIGDSDLKTPVTIIKRTDKGVYFKMRGEEEKRTKVFIGSEGIEYIYPTGKYSMSPTLWANKLDPDQKESPGSPAKKKTKKEVKVKPYDVKPYTRSKPDPVDKGLLGMRIGTDFIKADPSKLIKGEIYVVASGLGGNFNLKYIGSSGNKYLFKNVSPGFKDWDYLLPGSEVIDKVKQAIGVYI